MIENIPAQNLAIDVDVHDLNKALEKTNHQQKKEGHRLPENISTDLGHLDEHLASLSVAISTQIAPTHLEALKDTHLDLISKVTTKDNLQDYERLVGKLETAGISALSEAIEASLNDPEKLIDICEIICLDPSISVEFRRQLHEILSKVETLVNEIKEYYFETIQDLLQPDLNLVAIATSSDDKLAAMKEISPFSLKNLQEKVNIPGTEDLTPDQLTERLTSNKQELIRITEKLTTMGETPLSSRSDSFNPQRSELINEMVHLTAEQKNLRDTLAFNASLA